MKHRIFSHGGDLGDLIAGLPSLVRFGGGELVLNGNGRVREPWNPQKVERVREFLLMQEYIRGVRYADRAEGTPLDGWRRRRVRHRGPHPASITDWHLNYHRQPAWPHSHPWLTVDRPERVAAVVFNRTARYHGDVAVMRRELDLHRADAVFLGTPDEWRAFVGEVGYIMRHDTPTLMDAARVIAGADLYVGNQSSLLWVAHGLQRPVVVEEWGPDPNCRLTRDGARYG